MQTVGARGKDLSHTASYKPYDTGDTKRHLRIRTQARCVCHHVQGLREPYDAS